MTANGLITITMLLVGLTGTVALLLLIDAVREILETRRRNHLQHLSAQRDYVHLPSTRR